MRVMTLKSFGTEMNAAIFGASGGLGSAFAEALRDNPGVARVQTVSRGGDTDHHCDYHDEESIAATVESLTADGPLHLVICTIGILHGEDIAPEKTWKSLDADVMAQIFAINTIAPVMIAKHVLPALDKGRKTAYAALSARVGSIGDNRIGGWLSYRSSKAALNMAIRTLSIELARVNKQALILGLHPGTVETGLSQPFRGNVPDKQLFTPAESVEKMLATIDAAQTSSSGAHLAYDGSTVDP
jgi:NAD(P)-dependent dehydrogenase (short-subunit alcohol dehydrogenase family)